MPGRYMFTCDECGRMTAGHSWSDQPRGWLRLQGWSWFFFRHDHDFCGLDCLTRWLHAKRPEIEAAGLVPAPPPPPLPPGQSGWQPRPGTDPGRSL